ISHRILDTFYRLSGTPLGYLIYAPACLDLILHFVEGALARRRDGDHVVPDVAAARQLQRRIVDADLGGERAGDDVGTDGKIRNRLAVRCAAGTVGGIDRARGQIQFLRDLVEMRAGSALILDLVVQAE